MNVVVTVTLMTQSLSLRLSPSLTFDSGRGSVTFFTLTMCLQTRTMLELWLCGNGFGKRIDFGCRAIVGFGRCQGSEQTRLRFVCILMKNVISEGVSIAGVDCELMVLALVAHCVGGTFGGVALMLKKWRRGHGARRRCIVFIVVARALHCSSSRSSGRGSSRREKHTIGRPLTMRGRRGRGG